MPNSLLTLNNPNISKRLHRSTITAITATILLWPPTQIAAEFVGVNLPDDVLVTNISALAQLLEPESKKGKKASVTVSRLLGREALDEGAFRVWYCVDRNAEGKKSTSCGGDILLTRLDTGLWIIKDENSGAWRLVQQ